MTFGGLDALFNPSKRHMDEEKLRQLSTREEAGDASGGRRIDLDSGKVRLDRSADGTVDEDAPADDAPSADAAPEADVAEAREGELSARTAGAGARTETAAVRTETAAARRARERRGKPASA